MPSLSKKFCFFLSLLGLTFAAGAAESDKKPDTVTYKLDDFENSRFPYFASGSGGAIASISRESTQAHSGKFGAYMDWNGLGIKNVTNPYMKANYVDVCSYKIVGDPQAISLWVFAKPEQVGTLVRIIVLDATQEIFSAVVKVKQAGWSKLVFNATDLVSGEPNSGNHDKKLDLPATLFGIVGGDVGEVGSLYIDDIEATVKGTSRGLVEPTMLPFTDGGDNAWGHAPEYRFDVNNHSSSEIKAVEANITVTDVTTQKTAWEKKIEIPSLAPHETKSTSLTLDIPNGVYDLKWETKDAEGPLPGGFDKSPVIRISRMSGDVGSLAVGAATKTYMKNWGFIGGTYWQTPLDVVKKTGGTWDRQGGWSSWERAEKTPGHFDFTYAKWFAQTDHDLGIDLVWCTAIYNQPAFYDSGQEQYAHKYGVFDAKETEAIGDIVHNWELGNEDNGTAKYIWSEIARNGAAGIRSKSATAMIGTSGTASIDIGFMRLQQNRGVLDRLDQLITHPYTWASSPEAYGLESQFNMVDQVIDDVGGMKIQYTTEFGYSEQGDQTKRTQWIPRNYALAAAGGLFRHGLYSFDNEFGVYTGYATAFPSAVSLNAYAWNTYGYRFAGWFQHDAVYAAAYEKAGKPLIMAWSLAGTGQITIPITAGKTPEIHDMFGNVVPNPAVSTDGKTMTIPTSESSIYIANVDASALTTAFGHEMERALTRYQRCLAASELKDVPVWKALGAGSPPGSAAIRQALLDWQPKATPITLTEQAVIAQAIRMLKVANFADASDGTAPDKITTPGDTRAKWVARLKSSVAADVDLPSVRWVLHNWDETRDTMAFAKELKNPDYAAQLATLEPVYDHVAGQLADHGPQLFFPIWPYLHAAPVANKLVERFTFVPGKGVPVKVRLQSYSTKSYEGEVSFELPGGWKAVPATWKGKIDPSSPQELDFSIIAGNEGTAKTFTAVLTVPGKPVVKVPYDDFSVLPPLEIKTQVMSKLLPGTPLPLQVVNNGSTAIGATVRIVDSPGGPALAKAPWVYAAGGETKTTDMTLPSTLKAPAFNEWNLIADVKTSNRKKFQIPLSIDFDLAVKAKTPPTIDGDLSDWKDAAPLHIDQQEYTRGSYPTGWSKEDESGVAYTEWDEKNFYIAVHVQDQTFQQALSNGDVWAQDSVQFAIAGPDNQRHEFSLAQTPGGPQIWSNLKSALVTDGQLKVLVKPGEDIYEAAIPWSNMPGLKPTMGDALRFDVLLNDDDAIVKRRYLERYGVGIVACTPNDTLGYLHLGDVAPETAPLIDSKQPKVVFNENFEEYPDGAAPDTWHALGAATATMTSLVKSGVGIDGSKCLEVVHSDKQMPNVCFTMTRPLNGLTVGKKYRLTFKVKGMFVPNPTGMLVGTSLDDTGNVGYNWPGPWTPSDQWQEVSIEWTSIGGDLKVIIRNEVLQTQSLLIDDIKVTEQP